MHLAYVSVRNYRGIRRLELTLGSTTTLIGENAYGKSNLLDALLVCLGVGTDDGLFAFLPADFRRHNADSLPNSDYDPIEILLGFRESRDDEWDVDPGFAALRPGIHRGPRGERRVEFRVRATRSPKTEDVETTCDLVDAAPKTIAPAGLDVIELFRARVPVVVMKADRYFTLPSRVPHVNSGAMTDGARRSVAIEARLEEEIASAYHSLADQHEDVPADELRRGIEAARAYVERFGGDRLQQRVTSFLGPSLGATGVSGAARSMALLLVLGGLLAAHGGSAFGPNANPVIAIEDAEAYLHPTILAAVAAVIRAIPAQKILTTNAGEMLAMVPIASIRRLVRFGDETRTYRLGRDTLSHDEMRRVGYHVKANRGSALFARCWLLVEGETEFWLLPELAESLGYDFGLEGVRLIEFAQCGVEPLVKLADDLGIAWHVLADGDQSGRGYVALARSLLAGRAFTEHVTALADRDIEHCLWRAGYDTVYRSAVAGAMPRRFDRRPRVENPTPTIERALRARSKPGMALAVAEAARDGGPTPEPLRRAIEHTIALARGSVR
ncbi:MAG: DUF2813 domain-containing protein [Phycisphaerae bacterium]|nr:DUF2813 domain-containing protein [Phycisphaerae bacterium]